jgi:hypothetical protein
MWAMALGLYKMLGRMCQMLGTTFVPSQMLGGPSGSQRALRHELHSDNQMLAGDLGAMLDRCLYVGQPVIGTSSRYTSRVR